MFKRSSGLQTPTGIGPKKHETIGDRQAKGVLCAPFSGLILSLPAGA